MAASTMLGMSIRQQQWQKWNQTAWLYISNKPDIDGAYDILALPFLILLGLLQLYGYPFIHLSFLLLCLTHFSPICVIGA
jgi:hypothetical protein